MRNQGKILVFVVMLFIACSQTHRTSTETSPESVVEVETLEAGISDEPEENSASQQTSESWPVNPDGWGHPCRAHEDCGWDDPCVPARCGPYRVYPDVDCEESAPPPGQCQCVENRCQLRPSTSPRPPSQPCQTQDHCGLSQGSGRCVVGHMLNANSGPLFEGGMCRCETSTQRCVFEWVEPVSCQTDGDCFFESEPRLHPVPRPASSPRPARPFRPCVDGEINAECRNGRCIILTWGC